jgi:hypothetical protein
MHKIRMWDKLQVARDSTEVTRERLDVDDAAAETEPMDTRPNLQRSLPRRSRPARKLCLGRLGRRPAPTLRRHWSGRRRRRLWKA